MRKFCANLGFLWNDRSLPEAIVAAKEAGFDAVECHWPYEQDLAAIKDALAATKLPMQGVNTRVGNEGEMGVAALAGRESQAKEFIDEALEFAVAVDVPNIHVMSGITQADDATDVLLRNLTYATAQAANVDKTILLEPLNGFDVPNYFINSTGQVRELIAQLGIPNLKLMFDCYHVQRLQGNLTTCLTDCLDIIGNIQFAAIPDRGPPDHGEINYAYLFDHIEKLGYTKPLSAEYKPANGDTEASLDWLSELR